MDIQFRGETKVSNEALLCQKQFQISLDLSNINFGDLFHLKLTQNLSKLRDILKKFARA